MSISPKTPGRKKTAFRKKNQALQHEARAILRAERPMTLRALYYRLASGGHLPATDTGYQQLKRLMANLRETGEVPITGWLVDRIRSTLKPSSWSGIADYGAAIRDCYRKDLWALMPHHVEVFVEKDAIAGTIQPVTEEYNIALNVIRGDVSISFAGEIAGLWEQIEKPIYVYYLGDFDPSGFGIEAVLRDKLERYSGKKPCWTRLGVVADDFDAHNLIPLPVKTSARSNEFLRDHGEACAEVDALSPTELRARVRDAIESHIDQGRWERLQRVEELEKETIIDLTGKWSRHEPDLGSFLKSDLGPESGGAA